MQVLSTAWFAILLTIILFAGTIFVSYSNHTPPAKSPTVHTANVNGSHVAALWNTQTGHIEQLTFELRKRARELDGRAQQLKETEERVHNEKLELKRFQAHLTELQRKLDETILIIENEEVKNLRDMAVKYSSIEPDAIIKVFDAMDDVEVVKVLYFMDKDAQAAIFSAMIDQKEVVGFGGAPGSAITGPQRVVKLNEMLKFAVPPQKKKGDDLFQ